VKLLELMLQLTANDNDEVGSQLFMMKADEQIDNGEV